MTGPQSKGPINETLTASGIVRSNARPTRARLAKNLPSTICSAPAGLVSRLSIVPERRSSDQVRILSDPTRKMSSTGIHWNSGFMSAMFLAKKASAQKKINNVAIRNAPTKSQAAGEAKKPLNSFLNIFQKQFIIPHLLYLLAWVLPR